MVAVPEVAGTRPVIIRIVVVLPAPFGPRKPVTVPGSSAKDTSSTTVRSPYCLVSPLTVIIETSVGRSVLSARNLPGRGWSPRRPQDWNPGPRTARSRHPKVDSGDPLPDDSADGDADLRSDA